MCFAVHEIEAWFLSDLSLFPTAIRASLARKARYPEALNFDDPPKKLLKRMYREKLKQEYKEVTHGYEFFSRLDPSTAASRCPNLKAMLDEMLRLAKDAEN
jgi:hypothetical protein